MSILRMLPGSASQREIGAALFLSINTVKAYNKSLYRKLGAASRHEAVSTARRPRPDLIAIRDAPGVDLGAGWCGRTRLAGESGRVREQLELTITRPSPTPFWS